MRKIVASAVLALGLGWSFSAAADPVHLKFAFDNPDTDAVWVTTLKPFIDELNAADPSKLVVDPFPNGALGKNLAQQPQMVQSGVADIAFVIPSITPGRFADTEVLGLPGMFQNLRESTLAHTAMVQDGDFKSYSDFVVLGALGSDPFSIHTVGPVSSVDDLKGKKIRSGGGVQSHVLQDLGAVPVFMGLPDVAEALGRRNLDGVAIQLGPLYDAQLPRIVTHHYFVDVGGAPIAVLMNKKKFDSLPDDVQKILLDHRASLTNRYIDAFTKRSDDILTQFKAPDSHQTVVYPSDADMQRIAAVYDKEVKAWAASDPAKQDMLTKLQDTLKKLRGGNN